MRDAFVNFKNATLRFFHAAWPVAGLMSYIGLALVVAVEFHDVREAQHEAKETAAEAAAIAVTVAKNQTSGHDSLVKACIQERDAQVTQADGDDLKADNDEELARALAKVSPEIAPILERRKIVERTTANAIRGDLTQLCQYQFIYPPKKLK